MFVLHSVYIVVGYIISKRVIMYGLNLFITSKAQVTTNHLYVYADADAGAHVIGIHVHVYILRLRRCQPQPADALLHRPRHRPRDIIKHIIIIIMKL